MARQGAEKRRTGCVTCKKRRVKCDETRPVCKRCRVGDRSCAYVEPPVGTFSWQQLLQFKPPISSSPASNVPQRFFRSLDYFRCVVAPTLGSPLGSKFWTEPVLQIMMSESAAMHGVLAISMLYEGFEPSWKNVRNDDAALKHYNNALRLVATSTIQDDVVLIASVLFICIEFLRGNKEAAITHCRHGILISKTVRTQEETVSAMVRHLSIFPHFFSTSEVPQPARRSRQAVLEDQSAAALQMDELMGRSIRLVRSLDAYRLGGLNVPLPVDTWSVQQNLLRDLVVWKAEFEGFCSRSDVPKNNKALLLMRFLVCWTWTSIAPDREETASDRFREEFAQIIELSNTAGREATRSVFMFDMGVAPLLHFVIIKCRFLPLRLKALESIRRMGNLRESLWDTLTMYAVGKCIIEREHGVVVRPGMSAVDAVLPDDERRVRDSYVEETVFENVDYHGDVALRRRVCLFVLENGAVTQKMEWITSKMT